MERYFTDDSLIIVGNRKTSSPCPGKGCGGAHYRGLQGSDQVISLANERNLPVISTTFDTFGSDHHQPVHGGWR